MIRDIQNQPLPTRRHRSCPRVFRRIAMRNTNVKHAHHKIITYDGPPEIFVFNPRRLTERHCDLTPLFSLPVTDQDRAKDFYINVLKCSASTSQSFAFRPISDAQVGVARRLAISRSSYEQPKVVSSEASRHQRWRLPCAHAEHSYEHPVLRYPTRVYQSDRASRRHDPHSRLLAPAPHTERTPSA